MQIQRRAADSGHTSLPEIPPHVSSNCEENGPPSGNISCRQTEQNTFQESFTLEPRRSLPTPAPSSGLCRIFSRSKMQSDQLVSPSKHVLMAFLAATGHVLNFEKHPALFFPTRSDREGARAF